VASELDKTRGAYKDRKLGRLRGGVI